MDKFDDIGRDVKSFGGTTTVKAPEGAQSGPMGGVEAESIFQQAAGTVPTEPAVNLIAGSGGDKEHSNITRDSLERVTEKSPFMTLSTEWDEMKGFVREYHPALQAKRCVADRAMLFNYMVKTERTYNVTLSFPAYGVDSIVFDEEAAAAAADIAAHQASADGEGNTSPASEEEILRENISKMGGVEVIMPSADEGGEFQQLFYEKIEVDGVLYFSCLMECLDKEYMHSIIREATEEIFTHGQYMYTLVGPRPLVKNGEIPTDGSPLIETLKLNTYEMNMLINYMSSIEGVEVTHGIFDGRQAILFKKVS